MTRRSTPRDLRTWESIVTGVLASMLATRLDRLPFGRIADPIQRAIEGAPTGWIAFLAWCAWGALITERLRYEASAELAAVVRKSLPRECLVVVLATGVAVARADHRTVIWALSAATLAALGIAVLVSTAVDPSMARGDGAIRVLERIAHRSRLLRSTTLRVRTGGLVATFLLVWAVLTSAVATAAVSVVEALPGQGARTEVPTEDRDGRQGEPPEDDETPSTMVVPPVLVAEEPPYTG